MSNIKENDIPDAIKIILLGSSGVGKTSIINRFHSNDFKKNTTPTIAMNFIEKKLIINGKILTINLWDTAGQEKYKSINKLFIKNSNIVILVYGINSKDSFNELNFWYEFIENELGEMPFLCLVANKIDLVEMEEVSEEEGKELANKWGAFYAQLSAKCDEGGINKFFTDALTLFINGNKGYLPIRESIIIQKGSERRNHGCCGEVKLNKEKNIKIIFFGGKGSSMYIKRIIKAIIGVPMK